MREIRVWICQGQKNVLGPVRASPGSGVAGHGLPDRSLLPRPPPYFVVLFKNSSLQPLMKLYVNSYIEYFSSEERFRDLGLALSMPCFEHLSKIAPKYRQLKLAKGGWRGLVIL